MQTSPATQTNPGGQSQSATPPKTSSLQPGALQNQGLGAFNNPQVQQSLQLTPAQQNQLRKLELQSNNNLLNINRRFASDPQTAARGRDEVQRQQLGQLNSILNPQQLQMWRQMTGNPLVFSTNTNAK